MWYEWATLQDFDVWHDELCEQLGYPITPVNQATGIADHSAQKVTDYTSPIQLNDKVIAWVEEQYAAGLTQTELTPINDQSTEA
jgi:myosin-crossreactive antigen